MRRAAKLGLLLGVLAGGGCAEFDEWAEPEHCSEYRRGGYQRDDRTPPPAPAATADEAGLYPDR